LLERARTTSPGGVHSNVRLGARPHPLFFERADGVRLWDADGNEYIDFVLGQGPMLLGHAHPAVTAAVSQSLRSGQLYAGQHRAEVELSELLCELLPCADQVRLSCTGSEAVHAALRMARAATGRRRVVKFEGHYHGWLDGIYAGVSQARLRAGDGRAPQGESQGQVVPGADELTVIPWNDARAVGEELARGDVAAVILEPVAANQAVILPQPGFLDEVAQECRRHGSALIFDEVITGFRLGLSGAQGRFGVTPDLAVFGKAMASGFPIACVAGRAPFFEEVGTGKVTHAGTFNGNVACVAAALATLRTLMAEPELYSAAERVGLRIISGLRALDGPSVQGLPQLFWVGFGEGEVRSAGDLMRYDEALTAALSEELTLRGIYTTPRSTWYTSGVHSLDDADRALAAYSEALEVAAA
jgi:glutamate-1-semialdehyde 2,1-aminomutase